MYVCDRRADRIQVFDRMGRFIRNIDVPWQAQTPSDGRPSGTRGSAVVLAFSPDPEQRFIYVSNQNNVEINILDRRTGQVLSRFGGGPGRYLGQFTLPHASASIPRAPSMSPNRKVGASNGSSSSCPSITPFQGVSLSFPLLQPLLGTDTS